MKSEQFRIKKGGVDQTAPRAIAKPLSESYHFNENLTDPGQPNTVGSHSTKFESFVNQLSTIKQGPFKIDQKYLQRLYSSGSSSSLIPNEGSNLPLTEFLQVKPVSLASQEELKRTKNAQNVAVKQTKSEEKQPKPLLKSKPKLPSLTDQELTKDEKRNSCDYKLSKDGDANNTSLNQDNSKPSTQDGKTQKEKGKEALPNLKSRRSRSKTQRRAESEGPVKEKSASRTQDTSSNRSDRRHTSSTPRKDATNKASKIDPLTRFGPLEQIKEINNKKSTINSNTKNNIQPKSTQNSTAVANSLSNRNKPTLSNNSAVETKTENKPVLAHKSNVTSNITSVNNQHQSPPSKIITISNHLNSHKISNENDISGKNDQSSGLSKSAVHSDGITAIKKLQAYGQNKNLRNPNQGGNTSLPQHSASSGPGVTLPSIVNQSQSSHGQNITSLITNGSALNLKPVYPSSKAEDQPKKKVVYVPPPQSNKLKFYVGGGNNSNLVKRVLAKRDWWEETEFFNTLFNLKWQQSYRGYRYDRLPDKLGAKQLVNHFEFHHEISTKDGLIKNLSVFCEANKVNLFDLTPLTFCFNMDDATNFDRDMQHFAKFFITHHPDNKRYPPPTDKKNQNVWYNFDYRKKGVYQHPTPISEQKISPYIRPIIHDTFFKGSSAWVLKPVGLNRGRGVEVFNSLETLNELLNECFQPSAPKKKAKKEEGSGSGSEDEEEDQIKKDLSAASRTFVIQKYIEDTLLINRRKFDIRVWVLVTHEMQLYFFKEGYLRTSSVEFSLDGGEVFNKFIHLTNNAVQKYSNGYGQHESGNQLSFKNFEEYIELNELGGDFRGKILPRMKELVKLSMQSVGKILNANDRKYCFEVFGYDFMIDKNFHPWLIEVNTNPCLDESSPLLQMLIPRMIDDAFKLSVDVIFPKPIKKPNPPQAKSLVSSEKKNSNGTTQIPTTLNLKIQTKEENGETKVNQEALKNPDLEAEEKKIELKEASNNNEGAQENLQIDLQTTAESPESRADAELKITSSPIKSSKMDEQTGQKEVIFSVEGYSDTENMWEFLCSLSAPKSPLKKDNKTK